MSPQRRRLLFGCAALFFARSRAWAASPPSSPIRIGLTPVILDDRSRFLHRWRRWLEHHLGAPVEFVHRLRYRDITELLLDRSLTAAWICGYPYVRHRDRLRLLAVPVYQGEPSYRSLIISGRGADAATSVEQLAGRVFAYSDPHSNSGYLYPVYRLREMLREDPQPFRRTFFTWGHRNTIDAVARGLADAGAVDSYVWETSLRQHPGYEKHIQVIDRSPRFGFPPLVTHRDLPEELHRRLAETLFMMQRDQHGSELLHALSLDGFEAGIEDDYAGIGRMMAEVDAGDWNPHA